MGKKITAYKVTNLNKVDTTLYIEGDHFITDKGIGVLVNGKIKTIGNGTPNLKDYVKKDEIKDFVTESEVQTMIDNAMNGEG